MRNKGISGVTDDNNHKDGIIEELRGQENKKEEFADKVGESEGVKSGDLEKDAKEKAHHRREEFRDRLQNYIYVLLALFVILLIVFVFIWGWHLLSPASMHWLTDEQLFKLQGIMSSGLLAVFVSDYARRHFFES